MILEAVGDPRCLQKDIYVAVQCSLEKAFEFIGNETFWYTPIDRSTLMELII